MDSTTIATGPLALLAFRADLTLTHDPIRGWTFRFHTKGLSDSALSKFLGQLMAIM